jgi:cyclase
MGSVSGSCALGGALVQPRDAVARSWPVSSRHQSTTSKPTFASCRIPPRRKRACHRWSSPRTDLGRFAGFQTERIVSNLYRAYAELDGAEPGAPIDTRAALMDMVAFGRAAAACLA